MTMLRPASTVVLLRHADAGFDVFLVRRHDNIAFMGGAHVFPGGRVDAADRLADPDPWCEGWRAAIERLPARSGADALAFFVAGARELFEEAGVLLARNGSGHMVAIDRDNESRFQAYRRDLTRKGTSLVDVLAREKLRLALDALVPYGHWVTPEIETRRFDTHFFLAVAPDAQQAAHCDHETTDGVWLQPADALARCGRGEIALPPPTWTTLRALSKCSSVEDAWNHARSVPVVRVEPCFREGADGTRLVLLPGDRECPPVEGFSADVTRFLLENGRWRPLAATEA